MNAPELITAAWCFASLGAVGWVCFKGGELRGFRRGYAGGADDANAAWRARGEDVVDGFAHSGAALAGRPDPARLAALSAAANNARDQQNVASTPLSDAPARKPWETPKVWTASAPPGSGSLGIPSRAGPVDHDRAIR